MEERKKERKEEERSGILEFDSSSTLNISN